METVSREVELGRQLWELEKSRKAIEKQAADLKAEYKTKIELLESILIEEGKSSTGHIDGVGEFSLKRQSFPDVANDRLPMFIEYLKKIGHQAIVKETIEANTLKTYLRAELEAFATKLEDDEELFDKLLLEYGLPDDAAAEEIAAKHFELVGVKTFQQVKVSHTGKGKA